MGRSDYYNDLKALAREKRALHNVSTSRFGLREARQIYKAEGIRIDLWRLPYKIKALYMCADGDSTVAIQKSLPDEPKLFALMHEYKHHLTDRAVLGNGFIHCGDYNANQEIEVGAEVFAAEFIYPESEFAISETKYLDLESGRRGPLQARLPVKGQLHVHLQASRMVRAHTVGEIRWHAVSKARRPNVWSAFLSPTPNCESPLTARSDASHTTMPRYDTAPSSTKAATGRLYSRMSIQ